MSRREFPLGLTNIEVAGWKMDHHEMMVFTSKDGIFMGYVSLLEGSDTPLEKWIIWTNHWFQGIC